MAARQIHSLGVLFARLTWLLLGPLALALLAFLIASSAAGWLTPADVSYFVVLAAMLFGRWWEYHSGEGETADGEPMRESDLRRYLVRATALGLAAWVVVNLIGNHGLGS